MFKIVLAKFLQMDFVLLGCLFFLLTWSTIFIYGIGDHCGGDIAGYWSRQLTWAGLGLTGMFVIAMIDYHKLGDFSWLIFFGGCSLLVLVLIIGSEINGAKSWIKVPGATIQPAELAKPCALVMTSWLMSKRVSLESGPWSITRFILPGLGCAIPCLLVLIQPDLGSAFVFVPIFAAIAFVGGLSKRFIFLVVFSIVVLAVPVYKYALKDYQRKRVDTFIYPEKDLTGAAWNAHQSKLAVGSGGLHGKGLGNGTMYILGYLPRPVAPTDFIHSVVAEETGFVGSSILIFVYLLVILRAVHISAKAKDYFGKFLAVGFVTFLITHCYINIGMTMGVAPIIGVPLPFVSYGGSFMIASMAFMGILQSVHVHRNSS